MKAQARQGWNRKKPQGRTKRSAVPRAAQRMESDLHLRCLVSWTASIHCGRCRGLMYRIQLRDWGGSRGQDGCDALQCIACGDVIDPVIMKNRRWSAQSAMVRRRAREGRPRFAMAL